MRLSELEKKIEENNKSIHDLHKQISTFSKENHKLLFEKENKLIVYFADYLEVGTVHNVSSFLYLSGIQTGKSTTSMRPTFQKGDVFEVIKKNNKSIIIKCTSKVKSSYQNGKLTTETVNYTDLTFRIDTFSLYHELCKDPAFADSFKKYVTRKEALDLIGI